MRASRYGPLFRQESGWGILPDGASYPTLPYKFRQKSGWGILPDGASYPTLLYKSIGKYEHASRFA